MKKSEIPARYRWRVKHRQVVMAYARTHSLRATAKHFGLNRKTVRRWYAAWRAEGLRGLIPRYANRRPRRISPELVALITEALLAAAVNSTVVAGENLTVGSTVWLPAEGLAPGR
jgi:transposase